MRVRSGAAVLLTVGVLATAACSGGSSGGGASPSASPASSSSTGLPGDAVLNPAVTLAMVQPDQGVGPVVGYLAGAKRSIDIAVYQMDPTYAPVIAALEAAKKRGVKVRILLSRTVFPPGSPNSNPSDVAKLRARGFDAALSDPAFSYSHWKVIVRDAAPDGGQALVCDFNLEPGYFGLDPAYPKEGGTRGMAALVTDPAMVHQIEATFDADFPPSSTAPANHQPDLVWAPSASSFSPQGNAVRTLTALIAQARTSLDVYAQELAEPSELLAPLVAAAQRGVRVRIVGNDGGINTDALSQLKAAGATVVYNPKDPDGDGKEMYIHTKTMVADGRTGSGTAYLGSVNPFLDQSLMTERELGVLVTAPASLTAIEDVFDRDFSASRPA